MTTNLIDARDQMFAKLYAAWNAASVDIVGYIPEIVYQGIEANSKAMQGKYWARASIQTILSQQSTLSTCEGEIGQKRYTESGLFFLQVFSPKSMSAGMMNGLKLAQVARNAFRGTQTDGAVWFRNARINELDPEQEFFRANVVVEFEYDELH